MTHPDIAIAIPTYCREAILIDTIKACLAQRHKNIEVLVIDQTLVHEPPTQAALETITDPRFRYFLIGPPSLPAARNFALSVAQAPIVIFIDDDVKLTPDFVTHYLRAFAAHPDATAIGGRVLQKGFPIKKDVLRFDDYAVSNGVFTATEAAWTNAFPGGNHALKVKEALKLGGFDTRYYYNAFREESDMSMRLTKAGHKIYYEPNAELLHLAAHGGGTRAKQTYTHIYDNPAFYRNELFFTLRNAKYPLEALNRKYEEYCKVVPSRKQKLRRSFYFFTGLIAAQWRRFFGRQIKTVVLPSQLADRTAQDNQAAAQAPQPLTAKRRNA